jgi:signal transduction histidine kinase
MASEGCENADVREMEASTSARSPLNELRRFLPRGDTLPDAVWEKRHRFLVALLVAHAIALPIFGIAMGFSVAHSILDGGLLPGAFALTALLPGPRKLRGGLATLGLLTCSALLVHLSGGYIEAHFHFFIVIILIGLYEDWLPFGLALAFVVLHHGVGGAIDPSSVYNHPAAQQHPWLWAAIHGAAISLAAAFSIGVWKLNEDLRAERLTATRARLVAAADETRRRMQRDVHDGAQQRLVHTIVTLKLVKAALGEARGATAELVDEALLNAERASTELRELVHGIMPAELSRGGLRAGVESLIGYMDLPVRVDVSAERLPARLETTAYFIIAETLTNVVKHAGADSARVTAVVDAGVLHLDVRDDGVGGADRTRGTGLVGLADRVAASDGTMTVTSPPGEGTTIVVELPIEPRSLIAAATRTSNTPRARPKSSRARGRRGASSRS